MRPNTFLLAISPFYISLTFIGQEVKRPLSDRFISGHVVLVLGVIFKEPPMCLE